MEDFSGQVVDRGQGKMEEGKEEERDMDGWMNSFIHWSE